MKNNKSKIVSAFILLLALDQSQTVWAQHAAAPDNNIDYFMSGNTTEFTLAADEVQTKLLVPSDYIDWDATEAKNNIATYLYLKMLWPSLEATTVRTHPANQKEYEDEQNLRQSGQFFRIQLMQGKWSRMGQIIQDNIKNEWDLFPGNPPIHGFARYVSKIMKPYVVDRHQAGYQILVPSKSDYSEDIYIECPANYISISGLYCAGHIYLGDYVYGEYDFPMIELDKWKEIDKSVRIFFVNMRPTQNK